MKVVGLITEYNPFHNGHQYHIEKAKKETKADYVIVVMSGNFVQRGTPAIVHKYARCKSALESGADFVFELPVAYSTASAEYFALGAISLLDQLGVVDYLCFGSEVGDIDMLRKVADFLLAYPKEYNTSISKYMKTGISFPYARAKAIKSYCPEVSDQLLSSPNNILGIEYIKALIKLESKIIPITISRKEASYHESSLNQPLNNQGKSISSATSIRNIILEGSSFSMLKNHMPDHSYKLLEKEYKKTFPIVENDFSLLLNYSLLQENKESLLEYIDIKEDLGNRIINLRGEDNFTDLVFKIKSKQWTHTRINRVLIHILLNLKTKNLDLYNEHGYCQYGRLLGLNKSSSPLLRKIKDKNKFPIITNLGSDRKKLSKIGLQMLEEDIYATHLYNLIIQEKFAYKMDNEYKQGICLSNH